MLLLAAACGSSDNTGPTPPGDAACIVISPPSATLLELDSVAVTAQVLDARGRVLERRVEWESSDYEVASLPMAGWVHAGRAGQAVLHARVDPEGVTATMQVGVTERAVAAVVIAPALDTIVVGGISSLTAEALDEHGRSLWWRHAVTGSSSGVPVKILGQP